MELQVYGNNWLNISLEDIHTNQSDTVPGSEFYERFYREVAEKKVLDDDIDNIKKWKQYKISVANLLESNILAPLNAGSNKSLSILSLGVGTGIIEKEWLKNGYD